MVMTMNRSRNRTFLVAASLAGLGLLSCLWSATTISGAVRVASILAPVQSGPILLLVNDDDSHPLAAEIAVDDAASWSPGVHGPGVLVPSGRMQGETSSFTGVQYQPGVLEYFYWYSELDYLPTEVYLGAFIDLDGNGELDEGEPWGPFGGNPLVDLVDDASTSAPNHADIFIDRLYYDP